MRMACRARPMMRTVSVVSVRTRRVLPSVGMRGLRVFSFGMVSAVSPSWYVTPR
jgi:hypothetical protein